MLEMRKNIHQSLSTRLCLSILLIVILVFTLSLGFLYWQSRNIIRQEAIDEASHVLDNTALRVKGQMQELETATRNLMWLININHQQVQGTDASVFENLQQTLEQFMNERQWTALQFQENERIQCSFNITVSKYDASENKFTCTAMIQANRPVYNSA